MYEVDKISALVEQTLKQEQLIRKAETLEESIESIDKTICLYYDFVSRAELQFSETMASEDKEKLNNLKDCLEDFVNLLKEKKKEFVEIQNEFRFTSEKDYDDRLSYIENLIQFNSISQRIKIIEYNSKKMAKSAESSSFVVLLSAEGRKKKIYKADAEEYEKLALQKKELNRQLKKQYTSILKNYDKELNSKNNYIVPVKKINTIEPIREKENDINYALNINSYHYQNIDADRWIRTKRNLKTFLMNNLNINDLETINQLLRLYNEGIKYNLDFKMSLFSLGYSQDVIDYIVKRFDRGPKPEGVSDNLEIALSNASVSNASIFDRDLKPEKLTNEVNQPEKKGKLIKFVKKKASEVSRKSLKRSLENVVIFIGITILSTSAISYGAKKIPKIIDKIADKNVVAQIDKPINNLGIEADYDLEQTEESISITKEVENINPFENIFTVSENAFIYTNMYDAYTNVNQIEPYYSSNTPRKVKAIILSLQDKLYYITNQDEYNNYLNSGAKPVAVLSMIDDFTEGFYQIGDTNILGKGTTR